MNHLKKIAVIALSLSAVVGATAMAQSPHGAPAAAPAAPAEEEAATPAADDPELARLMALGGPLYGSNCVPCHGAQGEGGSGPPLAGADLSDVGSVAGQIIHGGHFMPSFSYLTNDQVAAIGTFIRNSWGNEFGILTAEDAYNFR
ncbi:MAG: cytochrome c [Bauldia sp.]|nr:cytochrome c [Bauldia sp.]